MENGQTADPRVILVSGTRHCGKTTLVETFLASAAGQGRRIAGILAKGLWQDNLRAGFDLVNLADGRCTPLARRWHQPHPQHRMMFDFLEAGFEAGRQALAPAACRGADIVVVDEVGRLEAREEGWASCVRALLACDGPLIILIVRLDCLERIVALFGLCGAPVIDARETDAIDRLRRAVARLGG